MKVNHYFDLQGVDERPDSHLYLASYLIIRDGFVHFIWIWMKAHITLQEVLEALGTPDMIHMSVIDSVRAFNFIYPDALVSVWLKANVNECDISRLGQDFWASSIWYYSPEAAIEPVDRVLIDRLQPALYAYDNPYERDVPLDIWETWLSGEVDLSCEEAVEQLPEEVIYPTVMPTMLGTIVPSPTPATTPLATP